mgnify:FL=1
MSSLEEVKNFVYGFEKLIIWQKSIELAKIIYSITSKFPRNETYGLSSQIQRAVVSISSNIAEGYVKYSPKEQIKFSETAYGSLMEVLNQTIIAKELDYISKADYLIIRQNVEEISRMLNALRNSQLKKLS